MKPLITIGLARYAADKIVSIRSKGRMPARVSDLIRDLGLTKHGNDGRRDDVAAYSTICKNGGSSIMFNQIKNKLTSQSNKPGNWKEKLTPNIERKNMQNFEDMHKKQETIMNRMLLLGDENTPTPKSDKMSGKKKQRKFSEIANDKFKRLTNHLTIGTALNKVGPNQTEFSGRATKQKQLWLFVSQVKDEVSEEVIRRYLVEKLELNSEEEVSVKLLGTYHKTKNIKCFQIGVEFKHKKVIYDSKFWPSGVASGRYNLNKERGQLSKPENFQFQTSENFQPGLTTKIMTPFINKINLICIV
ncbi:hypothetical protein HHI36_004977 [Cryptolaemus montrouzieri]|uniref:Uncharacterized protein n=1 Tax=Cryptolaemus montrouzieri TaxID=559131 RepID=A0ABD2NST6_9CUCU